MLYQYQWSLVACGLEHAKAGCVSDSDCAKLYIFHNGVQKFHYGII